MTANVSSFFVSTFLIVSMLDSSDFSAAASTTNPLGKETSNTAILERSDIEFGGAWKLKEMKSFLEANLIATLVGNSPCVYSERHVASIE